MFYNIVTNDDEIGGIHSRITPATVEYPSI